MSNEAEVTAALERLETLLSQEVRSVLQTLVDQAPWRTRALSNLERWMRASASPEAQWNALATSPTLAKHFITLLGYSQPLADVLIQEPALAGNVFDLDELSKPPTRQAIEGEAMSLLASSTSFSHALDRLRYLKQRWTLKIAFCDLAGMWEPPLIWQSLSELAYGLLSSLAQRVWTESPPRRDASDQCPVAIVALGKLGGNELNYSSDIDIVFVAPQGVPGLDEKHVDRFCEEFVRAASTPMGRGFLYRVDVRLRPYGAAGPIAPTLEAIEHYYRLYAEPWEQMALIRSQVAVGDAETTRAWTELRDRTAFPTAVSDLSLDNILQMKSRAEVSAGPNDIKRSEGGIRDAEFLVQIQQFTCGGSLPALRVRSTLDGITALESFSYLDHAVATALRDGYIFLRQLEHRIQMIGDQQTHALPSNENELLSVAVGMGLPSSRDLLNQLEHDRRTIRTLYQAAINPPEVSHPSRGRVAEFLGPLGTAALQWFDPLPESSAFYEGLSTNADSLNRVSVVLNEAPALVNAFRRSLGLTEALMSGEIEEPVDEVSHIDALPIELDVRDLARSLVEAHTRTVTRWLGSETTSVWNELAGLFDAMLRHCSRRLYASFDLIALGSYGRSEPTYSSDIDVLLLCDDLTPHLEVEQQAQSFLLLCNELKRLGAPLQVDIRLRPEGRQGLLARTYDGLRAYSLTRMELWERFALGSARIVCGSDEGLREVQRIAYGLPLTPERIRELVDMKRRIETERVPPQLRHRNVKLGYGGLGDIEWFVHLHEMRYPTATQVGSGRPTRESVLAMTRASLINAVEADRLLAALNHHLEMRMRLALLGFSDDTIPENPNKLERLAHSFSDPDGNSLLKRHEDITKSVRATYEEGLERLRA